jgi:hypothetical protein
VGSQSFLRVATLITSALGCASCITVEGQSSGQMQRALQQSYLVQAAKRFYPNETLPDDPALVSPQLTGRKLVPIQKELADLATVLKKQHASKLSIMQSFGLQLAPKVSPRVSVVNGGRAAAHTLESGMVTVDARVLQSIFRGAVLEVYRGGGGEFDSLASMKAEFDDSFNPSMATQEQRDAIAELLKTVRQIDEQKGRTRLGDVVGMISDDDFDSPWFNLADLSMRSDRLQTRYVGAILFLLAHEQGHLALAHFKQRDELERADVDQATHCAGLRRFEQEADAYALLLLSPHTSGDPSAGFAVAMFDQLDDMVGYRNFFVYGYNLSGFAEHPDEACTYETNRSRYESLNKLNEVLLQRSGEAFEAALSESLEHVNDDPNKK